jgi:hypothetical protein
MRRTAPFLAAAAAAAALAAAPPGASPRLVALEQAVGDRAATSADIDPALLTLLSVHAILQKPSAGKTLAKEIGAVAKARSRLEAGAPGETALLQAFDDAAAGYLADLTAAHDRLSATLFAQGLPKKTFRKVQKARDALATIGPSLPELKKAAGKAKGYLDRDFGASHVFVIRDVQVVGETGGLDLDGDGLGDNALGAIRDTIESLTEPLTLDDLFADALTTTGAVLLVEVFGVNDPASDKLAFVGVLAGADTDGDASDNFAGAEVFLVNPADLGADGHARNRSVTRLTSDGFVARIADQALLPGGSARGIVAFDGTVAPGELAGVVGAAVPIDDLIDFLEDAGIAIPPEALPLIRFAADVDLDGDGTQDAFSLALRVTAVPAGLTSDV